MSISRTAYLSLSALLAIVPAACGGDDDGDGGGAADSGGGGQADAGGGEADAGGGEADAGEPDAAPVEGDQYLLGVALPGTPLGDGLLRLIATVDVADDGTSADFSLQPIFSPNCPKQGESGIPTGSPLSEAGVAITKGAFSLTFEAVPITTGTLGIDDGDAGCALDITIDTLEVSGDVVKTGFCGDVTAMTALGTINGTFATVAIEAGTVGEDLPAEVTACP